MTTLSRFYANKEAVPAATNWLVADLSEFKGK